jgi:hypothetical protein
MEFAAVHHRPPSLRRRFPVQEQRDGGRGVVQNRVDQEATGFHLRDIEIRDAETKANKLNHRRARCSLKLVIASRGSGFGLPIQEDRDGRGCFFGDGVHQESLAVGRDHVLLPVEDLDSATDVRGK